MEWNSTLVALDKIPQTAPLADMFNQPLWNNKVIMSQFPLSMLTHRPPVQHWVSPSEVTTFANHDLISDCTLENVRYPLHLSTYWAARCSRHLESSQSCPWMKAAELTCLFCDCWASSCTTGFMFSTHTCNDQLFESVIEMSLAPECRDHHFMLSIHD